jgi:hypothetical protein
VSFAILLLFWPPVVSDGDIHALQVLARDVASEELVGFERTSFWTIEVMTAREPDAEWGHWFRAIRVWHGLRQRGEVACWNE